MLNAKVIQGRLNYYFALLMSFVYYNVFRKIINPSQFLLGESVVISNKKLLILNKYTSFGYYLNLRYFEPETYGKMESTIGKVFIDVGANAGFIQFYSTIT